MLPRALQSAGCLLGRVGRVLFWSAPVGGVAVIVNLIGIRSVGGIDHWTQWLRVHAGAFLVWRLCLYGVTGWGWVWMRQRLTRRESSVEARHRLVRIEVAAVLAIALIEGHTWWRNS